MSLILICVCSVFAMSRAQEAARLIDAGDLVTLSGNTRSEATPLNDRGEVDPAMPLEHLELQLRRSPEQAQQVDAFIKALHDPASPSFHQWLSAAQFGERFGASEDTIAAVRTWLESYGFRVGPVYPGGMVLDFSGTAAQLSAAFHTSIHHLSVDGRAHFANMSDPQIPRVLAPVVSGIVKLNDFRPSRKHLPNPKYSGSCSGDPCNLMAPADLATIYDFNSLFQAAAPITGKGQSIAVVEDTDLYSESDWTNFRRIFGLDKYHAGTLTTIHPAPPAGGAACTDPGVNSNGDDVEATLDAEWSSAAAPDASILLAACGDSATVDGVRHAIHDLITSASPPAIISISYGICETENGATANAFFSNMYQQAVAEGISVFVATGDSGPEDCAPNFTSPAKFGIGVNGWASTPNNVAVGGTDFSDTFSGTNLDYWGPSTGAPWGTAKSYIPEMAWNDTCASDQTIAVFGYATSYGSKGFCNSTTAYPYYIGTGGGEGGPSGCATGAPSSKGVVGGTCAGWPKPSYQQVFGMSADGVRDVPDVSMFASDGWEWKHQYLICFSDPNNDGAPCTGDPSTWGLGGGGTSYATPIVAGIQALVNQKTGESQGNPNFVYYALARQQYGFNGNPQCDASLGTRGDSHCVFHDVTLGNDSQDCKGSANCYLPSGTYGVMSTSDSSYEPAYRTHPGYDFPSGIGTIDAGNLVRSWNTAY
ncbi:MAG: S53 family peptidase [Steroidobacteraceae bacterium]